MNNDFDVDLVVTWVDGFDEKWLNKKSRYDETLDLNGVNRFRDMGVFDYWFETVLRYMPWVRKIYVVTDDQPLPFTIKSNKVVFVNHDEFIPKQYLPTFNSNVIELNMHRIEGLAEHYILANDDMYVTKPLAKSDFFSANGLPMLQPVMNIVQPESEFSQIVFNNMKVLNKHFEKRAFIKSNFLNLFSFRNGSRLFQTLLTIPYPSITGFYENHLMSSYLKSGLDKVWEEEYDLLDETSNHHLRSSTDVSIWLIKEWSLLSGRYEVLPNGFGTLLAIKNVRDLESVESKLRDRKPILVINDDVENAEDWSLIKKGLREKFRNVFGDLQYVTYAD